MASKIKTLKQQVEESVQLGKEVSSLAYATLEVFGESEHQHLLDFAKTCIGENRYLIETRQVDSLRINLQALMSSGVEVAMMDGVDFGIFNYEKVKPNNYQRKLFSELLSSGYTAELALEEIKKNSTPPTNAQAEGCALYFIDGKPAYEERNITIGVNVYCIGKYQDVPSIWNIKCREEKKQFISEDGQIYAVLPLNNFAKLMTNGFTVSQVLDMKEVK